VDGAGIARRRGNPARPGDVIGPAAPSDLLVVNFADLEWTDWTEGPAMYRNPWARLGRALGARKLGYHNEILPPESAIAPYHAHHVNEEVFLVLGGEPAVRLDGREHRLRAGTVVAVPPGPRSAHQILNRSDRPAHVLAISTSLDRDVVDYPDSGKRMLAVGGLPAAEGDGGLPAGEPRRERVILRDGAEASYFDGEPETLRPAPDGAPGGAEPDPRIVRIEDLPWERFGAGPFGGERRRLSRAAGARLLGYSVCRLAPGARAWPFHFHHVNEEFFYVRSGTGELRGRDGARQLRPGDAFACPPGPGGAHQIRNVGDAPLEYFALSTMEPVEVSEYPDSRKVYVMVGAAPGGRPEDRQLDAVFRLDDAVAYLEGEG
jgi:uncharacterized cupin superfamily protein